jgi:hypothetical protein
MKNIITMIFLVLNLSANELTKEQLNKLNTPMVKEENNKLFIENYNFINFKDKVSFGGKVNDKIIIKTKSIMKKSILNKEIFTALSSSASDQIINSIFLSPLYINKIKSHGLLLAKPTSFNLNIELIFIEKGFHITIDDGVQKETNFIFYNNIQ